MPNAVVEKVEPNAKKPDEWRTVTVGGKDFIVFSAELADALKVGSPLPEGTSEEPPKFDGALPSLRLPRPKGTAPQAAWRNTREGFLAEAEGRLRWQQVEEERRDRRTALMQAVSLATAGLIPLETLHGWRETHYTWLRQTSGASPSSASSPVGRSSQQTAAPEDVPPSGPVQGEGAANPPGGTTGEGGQAPSPTTDDSLPVTADDLADAAKHGLTPTKAKAIAASLGITVTKVTELTREQLAAVTNRYLEVKK